MGYLYGVIVVVIISGEKVGIYIHIAIGDSFQILFQGILVEIIGFICVDNRSAVHIFSAVLKPDKHDNIIYFSCKRAGIGRNAVFIFIMVVFNKLGEESLFLLQCSELLCADSVAATDKE